MMFKIKKHAMLLVPTIILFAAPLSAQVFVGPVTSGSPEERSYFASKIPEAVKTNGYELAGNKADSESYITSTLGYSADLQAHTIIVELYDTRSGNQIAANAMGYKKTEDMDKWNRYLIYELLKNQSSATAEVNRTASPRKIKSYDYEESASSQEADTYWVYLGPFLGAGMHLTVPDFALPNEIYLEGGLQVRVDFLRWLGVQLEAAYTADFAAESFFKPEMWPPVRHSLTIPVLFKFSFHPGRFVLSPYLGAHVDTPIDAFFRNLSWGADAGFSFGVTLGPGNLFLDVRGSIGLGELLPAPSFALGDSLTISASIGYEFAIGKK